MAYVPSVDLVPGVLAGEVRSIARLLTRAESGVEEARVALDAIFGHAGRAHIVGITGVPGSGKSTLVAKLAAAIRRSGRKVAIVAIDPSSPFTGGSILGDRIRMGELAGDAGVYVRSMATRGALGGLARGTLEAVDVLDAAGFDLVIIETVGVGQDEVEVARAAHTTVVISAPGLGDDIQAIKAGILEIADVHVVSKCDKPDASKAIADLKNMLALGLSLSRRARWQIPVVPTSSQRDEGIAELLAAIDEHWSSLEETGEIATRRVQINERRLLKAGEEILRDQFVRNRDGKIGALVTELNARALSPHRAAERLLADLHIGDTK
ncbi:MAG: methylmalonyl Co-A mutase-associated GTPase MeaB [Betaproteobacteria bacterium]|nr:MAG: methylmalonyl Co-A mutase-associated GTPase MeaB [Betaproteobacteria bacterium]TMH99984.1 MAG: methylmalonyl Co-A mutase-associated GTPase MeaB [Betaproteobacteria bacterium]